MKKAEIERLALINGYAAEVQNLISKILRHGFESWHPDDAEQTTNRTLLLKELADLSFAINLAGSKGDFNLMKLNRLMREKKKAVQKYLYYNDVKDVLLPIETIGMIEIESIYEEAKNEFKDFGLAINDGERLLELIGQLRDIAAFSMKQPLDK